MTINQITGEIIKSSLSLLIRDKFKVVSGQATIYPVIYKETIDSGMTFPSFFIRQLDTSEENVSLFRKVRSYLMIIYYQLPEGEISINEKLDNVANSLYEIDKLPVIFGSSVINNQTISHKKYIQANNKSHLKVDDVLQFQIGFKLTLKEQEDLIDKMEHLKVNFLDN